MIKIDFSDKISTQKRMRINDDYIFLYILREKPDIVRLLLLLVGIILNKKERMDYVIQRLACGLVNKLC